MKRLLYSRLLLWKENDRRKPLILNGARQVGKTWLLRHFGESEYKSVAYINCEHTTDMSALFSDFDIERTIRALSAYSGIDIKPNNTLIIIDEIQEYPRALTALKYFYEDAPQYHIAVAGSLLGISLHAGVSFPVGKVDTMTLYPMSLSEFIWAINKGQAAMTLDNKDWETISSLPNMYTDLLRQYYYVGGMPEAVSAYAAGAGPIEVRRIQKQILQDYRRDFSKHAEQREVPRINMIWDSIPRQLAKENKKFLYGEIKKGGRASEFEIALQWLVDAGLVYKVYRVNEPRMPLRFYEEKSVFKLFILDVGLLGALMDISADKILLGSDAFTEYKGALTEQYVLAEIIALGVSVRYYGTNDSRVEIDFMLQTEDNIVAVEVKAETNVYSKSLRTFKQKFPDVPCLRFSMLQYKEQEWMTNVPLYGLSSYLSKTEPH